MREEIGCKCPKCGGEMLESDRSYSCSNWANGCPTTIWKVAFHHEITREDAAKMLRGEDLGPLELVNKEGNRYTGILYLDRKVGKVKMKVIGA